VTTTAAGGAEVIEPGRSGAVVSPDDPRAVARAVETLAARPPDERSATARAAAEPFTHARQVAGFEAVYRRLPPRKR
jgi:glycosyltransferase involved in cell wall biosynthesis